MSNESTPTTNPLQGLSPNLVEWINNFSTAVSSGSFSQAYNDLFDNQVDMDTLVAGVTNQSHGKTIDALKNLWDGENGGVRDDGWFAQSVLNVLNKNLGILPSQLDPLIPPIKAGFQPIAPSPKNPLEFSQWMLAVNKATTALEGLNGILLDAANWIDLMAQQVPLSTCASGLTRGETHSSMFPVLNSQVLEGPLPQQTGPLISGAAAPVATPFDESGSSDGQPPTSNSNGGDEQPPTTNSNGKTNNDNSQDNSQGPTSPKEGLKGRLSKAGKQSQRNLQVKITKKINPNYRIFELLIAVFNPADNTAMNTLLHQSGQPISIVAGTFSLLLLRYSFDQKYAGKSNTIVAAINKIGKTTEKTLPDGSMQYTTSGKGVNMVVTVGKKQANGSFKVTTSLNGKTVTSITEPLSKGAIKTTILNPGGSMIVNIHEPSGSLTIQIDKAGKTTEVLSKPNGYTEIETQTKDEWEVTTLNANEKLVSIMHYATQQSLLAVPKS